MNWSTQQLAEFLATVSSLGDERAALMRATERAAEALEAEAAAVVQAGVVVASLGFPRGEVDVPDVLAVARGDDDRLEVPGLGRCPALAAPLEELEGTLVVARTGATGFTAGEAQLARGMGRVLSLAVRMLRGVEEERALRRRSEQQAEENAALLSSLRERQTLLERLSEIQRSIVRRTSLSDLLQSIVTGALELTGDEVGAVWRIDENDPTRIEMAAGVGMEPDLAAIMRQGQLGEGAGGHAISEDRLIVIEDYQRDPRARPPLANRNMQAAMAAPVRQNGVVCGSLVSATHRPGRTYSPDERDALVAFAEHASLALTDASNLARAMHQAFHDSLTDLPNREFFLQRLQSALRRAPRSRRPAGVLFLDLDGFKTVNDSLGHAAGDELLVAVAARLLRAVRDPDTVARFGGDEFAVLLEDLEGEEAAGLAAARLLEALREPYVIARQEVSVTASVGVATARREGEDLLRNADLAMYQAKSRGHDRFETFEANMHADVVRRLAMEGDLQRAVARGELRLVYQPIVRLRTGRVVGVEALLRWDHPEHGLMSPAEFIPVAEETRLIVPLGRWVLGEACRQAARWQRERPALAMAVNLSSVQIGQPDLASDIAGLLDETGVDPRSLILEITETVLMSDVDATTATLNRLKEIGAQLAVDDFGTGYSSLQYLRGFPIDILKIAKSFVDGVAGASDESALARAIIDLGDSFQLRVVAEGVEAPEQYGRLLDLGCELGQGYLFARPMEPAALERLLASEAPLVRNLAV